MGEDTFSEDLKQYKEWYGENGGLKRALQSSHSLRYYDLSQVKETSNLDKSRWLYDRKSKTWIVGIFGSHEFIVGALYAVYNNLLDEDGYATGMELEEYAEKYVEEGYGFYVSGSMNMWIPIKGDDVHLTEEEQIFNSLKGKLSWRGI